MMIPLLFRFNLPFLTLAKTLEQNPAKIMPKVVEKIKPLSTKFISQKGNQTDFQTNWKNSKIEKKPQFLGNEV
jgi:hypothetical protein